MTKEQLQERLQLYLDCERKIVGGAVSYKIGDRELRRAYLTTVRQAINALSEELKQLNLKHGRRKRVVFI